MTNAKNGCRDVDHFLFEGEELYINDYELEKILFTESCSHKLWKFVDDSLLRNLNF